MKLIKRHDRCGTGRGHRRSSWNRIESDGCEFAGRSMRRPLLAVIPMMMLVAATTFTVGCGGSSDGIEFLADAPSQTSTVTDFSKLKFSDRLGNPKPLAEWFDEDYLVIVITRGYDNAICLYCASQTSKWAQRYGELAAYNADLAVVFPTVDSVGEVRIEDMEAKIRGGDVPNASIPYPILVDFDLNSVDELGLRAELSKPATYIINRDGEVVYAYVGKSIADRPGVDAVLDQLRRLSRS